jgi:hypothetical protein
MSIISRYKAIKLSAHRIWPLQSECDNYYGNPRGRRGRASLIWEKTSLVKIVPPWQMVDEDSKKPIASFLMHRRVRDSINRAFEAIWELYNKDQAIIESKGLHLFSGSYVYRPIRGGTHLSMHAYGCAIDIAASENELGSHHGSMPLAVVKIFEEQEKWVWGGRWHGRPDPMHFQAANP